MRESKKFQNLLLRILLKWNKVTDASFMMLPLALIVFGCITTALLIMGRLSSIYVWPLGTGAAALTALLFLRGYGVDQVQNTGERKIVNLLVLFGVALWMVFNIFFASQHLITNRDPGVYTVEGMWLTKVDNLEVPTVNIFGTTPGVEINSGGFIQPPNGKGSLQSQGSHLLPALFGLFGRLTSINLFFKTNILIGGLALLAFYGFARFLLKPWWALFATATLAVTLPMLYFSRDSYTEPLLLMFFFTALSTLYMAQKYKKFYYWALAGIATGACALVRIDAYIIIGGLLGYSIIVLALEKRNRLIGLTNFLAYSVSVFTIAFLGWLDVARHSQSYYASEHGRIKEEFVLLALILFFGAVVVGLSWGTKLLKVIDNITIRWRPLALALIFISFISYLALRQFWYQGHTVNMLQAPDGSSVTRTIRNYDEQTYNWLIWYLGPATAILGMAGLAYAIAKASIDKRMRILASAIIIGGVTLFYLYKPSISPDQIWASRRLLPVIIPGLILFAFYIIEKLYKLKSIHFKNVLIDLKTCATVGATLIVVGPLFVSWPFLFTRETALLPPIVATCNKLHKEEAVLWLGTARSTLIEPTKSLCGIQSAGFGKLFRNDQYPTREILIRAYSNATKKGFVPLVGIMGRDLINFGGGSNIKQWTEVSNFTYNKIEMTYKRPPSRVDKITDQIFLGKISPEGTIGPL